MGTAWSLSFTGKDLDEAVLKAFAFWRDNQDWLDLTVVSSSPGAGRTRRAPASATGRTPCIRGGRGRLPFIPLLPPSRHPLRRSCPTHAEGFRGNPGALSLGPLGHPSP